jgi:hypothetical protein
MPQPPETTAAPNGFIAVAPRTPASTTLSLAGAPGSEGATRPTRRGPSASPSRLLSALILGVEGQVSTMKVDTHLLIAPHANERIPSSRRPRLLCPLLGPLGMLSLGGFIGGHSFVRDRTGAELGANLTWLQKTPVDDFFLPGLFLLGVYGIGSLLLMVGLAWRWSPGPFRRVDARLGYHWSWIGAIGQGGVLVAWILYEFVALPDQMLLQPIPIGVGVLMIALSLTPSLRRFYATSATADVMRRGEFSDLVVGA